MRTALSAVAILLLAASGALAENFRTVIAGELTVDVAEEAGVAVELGYVDSALIRLKGDFRFLKGVELELQAPQAALRQRGSIAFSLYRKTTPTPVLGIGDYSAERVAFAPLPAKLQTIYQIPTRQDHGLKASPYVSIPTDTIGPAEFPLLFRLQPVMKGLSEDLMSAKFKLVARPILTDQGAIRILLKYPEQLKDKPLTVLVNDTPLDNPSQPLLLKEGEHSLTVVSEFYRNESRTFMVERAKELQLTVELRDPTPLVLVEAPEGATVLFDDKDLPPSHDPFPVTPGEHRITFKVGDYTISRPITVIKGRSYRVGLSIDVSITEVP